MYARIICFHRSEKVRVAQRDVRGGIPFFRRIVLIGVALVAVGRSSGTRCVVWRLAHEGQTTHVKDVVAVQISKGVFSGVYALGYPGTKPIRWGHTRVKYAPGYHQSTVSTLPKIPLETG